MYGHVLYGMAEIGQGGVFGSTLLITLITLPNMGG